MENSTIEYHTLYTVELSNHINYGDINYIINNHDAIFTEKDALINQNIDMDNNPIRHRLLCVEINAILKFIYMHQNNFTYERLKRLKRLILSMASANNASVTNVMAAMRLKSVLTGFELL